MNHIFQEHPNYLKETKEAANNHHFTPVFRALEKPQNINCWLEWIITENREFKFSEVCSKKLQIGACYRRPNSEV